MTTPAIPPEAVEAVKRATVLLDELARIGYPPPSVVREMPPLIADLLAALTAAVPILYGEDG